jgi:hypothetical protein
MKKYPDVREILKRKEKHRRSLAALPFEEKIEMVFRLRERRIFVKSGRVVNSSRKAKTERSSQPSRRSR